MFSVSMMLNPIPIFPFPAAMLCKFGLLFWSVMGLIVAWLICQEFCSGQGSIGLALLWTMLIMSSCCVWQQQFTGCGGSVMVGFFSIRFWTLLPRRGSSQGIFMLVCVLGGALKPLLRTYPRRIFPP